MDDAHAPCGDGRPVDGNCRPGRLWRLHAAGAICGPLACLGQSRRRHTPDALPDQRLQAFSLGNGRQETYVGKTSLTPQAVWIAQFPRGWLGDWHENPKPQWVIPLSGRWFIETTDGHRVELGPGEASFGGDQGARANSMGVSGTSPARSERRRSHSCSS